MVSMFYVFPLIGNWCCLTNSFFPFLNEANKKENEDGVNTGLDQKSIKFNVAWNLWREVAECGVFLIPYMLGDSARSIPVSAVCWYCDWSWWRSWYLLASQKINDKFWLAFFLSNLTGWLAIGRFTGGYHEFEEVHGMTPFVWKLEGSVWSHKNFPMAIIKPFDYSHKRIVLQFACFWSWIAVTIG